MLKPFPAVAPVRTPWLFLAACAIGWLGTALPAQRELRRNVAVEHLVQEDRFREALDYLSARRPEDFAPSRPLPPRAFEREVFWKLPGLFAEVRTTDPPWVQAHLMQRFREMCSHFGPERGEEEAWARLSDAEVLDHLTQNLSRSRHSLDGFAWLQLLNGLERTAEGRAWLATNVLFLRALKSVDPTLRNPGDKSEERQREEWRKLTERIQHFLPSPARTRSPAPP